MKISIQTLGCKVNQAESASIAGVLRNKDHEIVKPADTPDICIINTCSVTAKSEHQSRQLIRKAVRSGAKVIATGCYAQLKSNELLKIPGLSLVVGNSGKDGIYNHLSKLSNNGAPVAEVNAPETPLTTKPYHSRRSRALLKVQDGCNFSCSYCTVPQARGKSRSMKEADVISAAGDLVLAGYKEIILTGIHAGSYGLDLKPKNSLFNIVNNLTIRYPDVRIRLSSIEPQEFSEDFISLIKAGNVCPHLHIPLQSGSDNILRKMNRGYTSTFYEQLINSIITSYPDMSIGTDIIVGHPGESEKDFNDTVKFIKKIPFSYIHIFPYSNRPNTKAADMQDHIPENIKRERVNILLEISNEKKYTYITRHLNSILNVIVENKAPINGIYRAISDNYLRISVQSDNLKPRQILRVKVISLTESGLLAKPL